ncbi:hypothetical protein R3P38DRAFT_2830651 [Favolaschia claudopus]|uniref:Phospholipid/glycerol acyltransferase domain-containing protein n=1 Tax=Favolaschia claudopus TaxID=2862362 RepID=A0AAW0EDP3_9AGAR
MEKYSDYRDPGTGLQPFIPLIPPPLSLVGKLTIWLTFLVGLVRTILVFAIFLVHLILVHVVSILFIPIPPLHRFVTHFFVALTARLSLAVLGVLWVSVDPVTRKRGRGVKSTETWKPKAGDIIVSNWVSWVEILWLAFRFNPIFVLPVAESSPSPATTAPASETVSHTPGRRTGTGSANIAMAKRGISTRIPILGFRQVSLLSALRSTGYTPPFGNAKAGESHQSLEELRKRADRPIVIFPECTTSNGRALLRFANVFQQQIPVRGFSVFVMCVRYDPPTEFAATLAHSIPTAFNPLSHVFRAAASLAPQTVSIRLLAPSESPSSQLFLASEVLTDASGPDQLADACAALIAQLGKLKRTGLGWEDKASFLQLFRQKEKR